jgi:hypothetical protein
MTAHRAHGLSLLLLLAGPAAAYAQNASEVGRIGRIAEILAGRGERRIEQATPMVQVQRTAGGDWLNAAPRTDVRNGDQLLVQRYVDVQVDVDRATHRGTLTFLPQVLRVGRAPVFGGDPASRDGFYSLADRAAGELSVNVQRGALVVDWTHGRLQITAANTRCVITGTRVIVAVDSTGNAGFLYVIDGTVLLLDTPGLVPRPGDVIRLQRGALPVRAQPDQVQVRDLADGFQYNNRQVWAGGRLFLLRPEFFVPALAAVTGGVVYAVTRNGSDDNRIGHVVIRIPFE